jgi:probable addiction module antidote protein
MSDAAIRARTTKFDVTEFLDSDESVSAYISEALAIGDPSFIADAIGVVARAKGMTQIAKLAGLSRESLYKALSEHGNPELSTLLKVIKALGLELSALPARPLHPDEIEERVGVAKAKAKPRTRRPAKVAVEA